MKIEVNKIMNPAFLLGTAFNIAYWHRKYHSGTICKGVSNPQTSNALSGCEKEENIIGGLRIIIPETQIPKINSSIDSIMPDGGDWASIQGYTLPLP